MTIGVLDQDGNPRTISTIDDLLAVVGVVGASPAANTLQDRLKALATAARSAGSDGSGTVAAGGTAQSLFSGTTPANGCSVANPDATEELWISLSTAAAPNAVGSIRIPPLGLYETPQNMKPFHAVSLYGATSGHKFTAISW